MEMDNIKIKNCNNVSIIKQDWYTDTKMPFPNACPLYVNSVQQYSGTYSCQFCTITLTDCEEAWQRNKTTDIFGEKVRSRVKSIAIEWAAGSACTLCRSAEKEKLDSTLIQRKYLLSPSLLLSLSFFSLSGPDWLIVLLRRRQYISGQLMQIM